MNLAPAPPAPNCPGAGWSSPVARQAHNLKVLGSNPSPATIGPEGSTAFGAVPFSEFACVGRPQSGFGSDPCLETHIENSPSRRTDLRRRLSLNRNSPPTYELVLRNRRRTEGSGHARRTRRPDRPRCHHRRNPGLAGRTRRMAALEVRAALDRRRGCSAPEFIRGTGRRPRHSPDRGWPAGNAAGCFRRNR